MNNKTLPRYQEINREERFYCMLLAHCLLSSPKARKTFFRLLNSQLGGAEPEDRDGDLQVFIEVAALRDYWRNLGDPKKWTEELENRRRTCLLAIIDWANDINLDQTDTGNELIPSTIFDNKKNSPFWTAAATPKLVSPGRWPMKSISAGSLKSYKNRLKRIRWAFNSKPDLLILTSTRGFLIEAKVGSGWGTNKEGYIQLQTQKDILGLWKHLELPDLSGDISLTTLGQGKKPALSDLHVTWNGIMESVDLSELDSFTVKCLQKLA